jgi:hypothetical protein
MGVHSQGGHPFIQNTMIWFIIWIVLVGIALFGDDGSSWDDFSPLRKIAAFLAAVPVALFVVGFLVLWLWV